MARKSRKGTCFKIKSRNSTIEIEEEEEEVKPNKLSIRLVKMFRIMLIFFYGQFFGNAVYTNVIHGVPIVIAHPDQVYPDIKVALGVIMIIHTLFSVCVIWLKNWRLIFASAISLMILSIVAMITSIIDLVQRNERNLLKETEMGSTITEISVETLLRALAIVVSLLIVRFLREIYHQVPAEDDENEEAGNDEEDE